MARSQRTQLLLAAAFLLRLLVVVSAQAASSSSSASAAAPTSTDMVMVYPGSGAWSYYGCYNETTGVANSGGVRALAGGSMEGDDNLIPTSCFAFCGSYQWAGMEYGRECWCGNYLNSLSAKLPDTECNYPCAGNSSLACGASLKLTLYQQKQGGSSSQKSLGATWKYALGDLVGLASIGLWIYAIY